VGEPKHSFLQRLKVLMIRKGWGKKYLRDIASKQPIEAPQQVDIMKFLLRLHGFLPIRSSFLTFHKGF
jgi:hypothetical protein